MLIWIRSFFFCGKEPLFVVKIDSWGEMMGFLNSPQKWLVDVSIGVL